jgi:hypothetical protein
MALMTQHPNDTEAKALASFGVDLLKMFHYEYEVNPGSRNTEYRRGQVTAWRQMLHLLYGRQITETIVDAAAEEANYTIPPAGDIDDHGQWIGFDSGAHMYIGRLHA